MPELAKGRWEGRWVFESFLRCVFTFQFLEYFVMKIHLPLIKKAWWGSVYFFIILKSKTCPLGRPNSLLIIFSCFCLCFEVSGQALKSKWQKYDFLSGVDDSKI